MKYDYWVTCPCFFYYLWNLTCMEDYAGGKGKVGEEKYLNSHLPTLPTLGARQEAFSIFFEWDSDFGIPGAFYIRNFKTDEFFLVSVTLDDIPNHGSIHFVCNSWVYNFRSYKKDRIFFVNNVSSAFLMLTKVHPTNFSNIVHSFFFE